MINTREIAEEYRLSHWARVMQERADSGLSIKAYCNQIGICGNTYFYWQRRVRAAACEQLALSVPEKSKCLYRASQRSGLRRLRRRHCRKYPSRANSAQRLAVYK